MNNWKNKIFSVQTAVFILGAMLLIVLDLWLKYWSYYNLSGMPPREIIPGFLGFRYVVNTGMAFGLFAGADFMRYALIIANIAITCGLVWYYYLFDPKNKKHWLCRVAVIMVFAGGIGNLYDRLFLGHVRDMLEFLFVRFAIFNLADVFVTGGVFAFLFLVIFIAKDAPLIKPKQNNEMDS